MHFVSKTSKHKINATEKFNDNMMLSALLYSQVQHSETFESPGTLDFFPNFSFSDFSILTQYPKSKTQKKKTQKKYSEVFKVSKFSICHFLNFW